MGLLALLVLAAALEPAPGDPCRGFTEAGAESRLCMNPGAGLSLSAGGGFLSASGAAELRAEMRFAGQRESRSKAATWLQHHKVGLVSARVGPDALELGATLYEASWRRHVNEPYLALPTYPPIRLPFPFDLSLYGSALTWERTPRTSTGWVLETTRGALMLDVLRSPSNRLHLAFGPELHHAIRNHGTTTTHELAPFTGGMVHLRLESEDGLWLLALRGSLGAVLVLDGAGAVPALQGRAELEGERVLFSINDQPLSLTLRASARLRDAGPTRADAWSAALGLSLRLFGSR